MANTFTFSDGVLSIGTPLAQMRLRWKPEPAAEEMLVGARSWTPCFPEFRLVRPAETVVKRPRAAPHDVLVHADADAVATKHAAFTAFREEIPAAVVDLVAAFQSHQWLLMLMLHARPEFQDLAQTNPVLAYCLIDELCRHLWGQRLQGSLLHLPGAGARSRHALHRARFLWLLATFGAQRKVQPAGRRGDCRGRRSMARSTPGIPVGSYDPSQHGSASQKDVLPALTGKSYGDMAISDGGMASREFLRVMFSDVDAAERQRVRQDLEAYCGLDTLGMLDILKALEGMAGS